MADRKSNGPPGVGGSLANHVATKNLEKVTPLGFVEHATPQASCKFYRYLITQLPLTNLVFVANLMAKQTSRIERIMSNQAPAADSPNFENSLAELEKIARQLEDGEVGLAEALGRYEQGVKLLKQCYQYLERAERKIELLTGVDAQGNPSTQPFDDTPSDDLGEKAQARSKRRTAKTNKPVDDSERDEPGGLF